MSPHPANATLSTVLVAVAHLEIKVLHYAPRNGAMDVDVALATCDGYEAAKAALNAKSKDERDHVMGSGARAREAEYALGIVSHVCFPHLDCWED